MLYSFSVSLHIMLYEISIQEYYNKAPLIPLVDVRSPAEFQQGHIVGAVNIPLFSNEERAAVGTIYKKKTKEKAIELGYEYVTPKLRRFWKVDEAFVPKQVLHWLEGIASIVLNLFLDWQ